LTVAETGGAHAFSIVDLVPHMFVVDRLKMLIMRQHLTNLSTSHMGIVEP
jgi:hypothetical protein